MQFLLSPCRQKVFEVLRFKEEPRSWFVEDSVQRGNGYKVKLAEMNNIFCASMPALMNCICTMLP